MRLTFDIEFHFGGTNAMPSFCDSLLLRSTFHFMALILFVAILLPEMSQDVSVVYVLAVLYPLSMN